MATIPSIPFITEVKRVLERIGDAISNYRLSASIHAKAEKLRELMPPLRHQADSHVTNPAIQTSAPIRPTRIAPQPPVEKLIEEQKQALESIRDQYKNRTFEIPKFNLEEIRKTIEDCKEKKYIRKALNETGKDNLQNKYTEVMQLQSELENYFSPTDKELNQARADKHQKQIDIDNQFSLKSEDPIGVQSPALFFPVPKTIADSITENVNTKEQENDDHQYSIIKSK